MPNQPFAALGRTGKRTLVGVGPHTPPAGTMFSCIVPCTGQFKARTLGTPAASQGHLSATGVYTGGTYAFPATQIFPGDYDEVTGDASFVGVAYLDTL